MAFCFSLDGFPRWRASSPELKYIPAQQLGGGCSLIMVWGLSLAKPVALKSDSWG